MNIKQAKQEIKNAAAAYLQKDEAGHYIIPPLHQRPILLIGPPGIGKTQIMEQIASECGLALCAYTITHHTRQSAIGLPYIREKTWGGRTVSITEYTMSEIIASIYDCMEETGKREGILFIDEINCVSETLAPTMLQFLQKKTFGTHAVPEGWIIAAAGNPPEYNKSVRDFDIVTLDRVRLIRTEADFGVWKEYAYEAGIHGSILAYLAINRENFYRVETGVDQVSFVTARGWQDLSEMLYACERLGIRADRQLIIQYLQHEKTALDFAGYLDLYYKYREDYRVDEILKGIVRDGTYGRLKFAPFDERLKVTFLLIAGLSTAFKELHEEKENIEKEYAALKKMKEAGEEVSDAGLYSFEKRKELFEQRQDDFEDAQDATAKMLEYAFDFMEAAFGESQEMLAFITELSVNRYAAAFLQEYDCDRYYMYNKRFLFDDREKQNRRELGELRGLLSTGVN